MIMFFWQMIQNFKAALKFCMGGQSIIVGLSDRIGFSIRGSVLIRRIETIDKNCICWCEIDELSTNFHSNAATLYVILWFENLLKQLTHFFHHHIDKKLISETISYKMFSKSFWHRVWFAFQFSLFFFHFWKLRNQCFIRMSTRGFEMINEWCDFAWCKMFISYNNPRLKFLRMLNSKYLFIHIDE